MITTILVTGAVGLLTFQLSTDGEALTYAGISEFTEMDDNGDRILTFEEYRTFHDSAYNNLTGANGPGAFGSAVGALLAIYGGELPSGFGRRARENPDSISTGCWAALEDSWHAHLVRRHGMMDADSDGQVSVLEYSERRTNQLRAQFGYMDRDGDGLLDPYEVMPSAEDEIAMRASTSRNESAHVAICFGDTPPEQREPMSEASRIQSRNALMTMMDLDGDNEISWAEFHASMGS
ncbi:hypothetical protein [Hyphobacterium sp.]|uniref:hypothetical protein n=1 Tax=Hyphobacterium sp. TaxID=2004662 RepID=UPI003747FBD3